MLYMIRFKKNMSICVMLVPIGFQMHEQSKAEQLKMHGFMFKF